VALFRARGVLHFGESYAPTYRPNVGGWATPFVGRIIALKILNGLGVRGFNGLPTVTFAINPRTAVPLVASYSYRMQANFSSPRDALARFAHVTQPLTIMIGSEDELFYADRFAPLIHHACADVPVILVPGVNHMGMVTDPRALAAITSLISSESRHPDCAAGTGPTLAVVLPPQTGRH